MLKEYFYKVNIIGDPGVGKSRVLDKLIPFKSSPRNRSDSRAYLASFQNTHLLIRVFDLSPRISTTIDEDSHFLLNLILRGSAGLILVFDITDISTLTKYQHFFAKSLEFTERESVFYLLIGNKRDLLKEEDLARSRITVNSFIQTMTFPFISSIDYIEYSSVSDENIEKVLGLLIGRLHPVESRCNNCYRQIEPLLYKGGFFFCSECILHADLEKAQAFLRLRS